MLNLSFTILEILAFLENLVWQHPSLTLLLCSICFFMFSVVLQRSRTNSGIMTTPRTSIAFGKPERDLR